MYEITIIGSQSCTIRYGWIFVDIATLEVHIIVHFGFRWNVKLSPYIVSFSKAFVTMSIFKILSLLFNITTILDASSVISFLKSRSTNLVCKKSLSTALEVEGIYEIGSYLLVGVVHFNALSTRHNSSYSTILTSFKKGFDLNSSTKL